MDLGNAPDMGPEQTILDRYLHQFDRYPNLPYCARMGGQEMTADGPGLPPSANHYNLTNSLLDEHMRWHVRHARLLNATGYADDNNTAGLEFVMMHRSMLKSYDDWRVANGAQPLAPWDPVTRIPPELSYNVTYPCHARASEFPGVRLPAWLTVAGGNETSPIFQYTSLCQFQTLNRLGKELDEEGREALLHAEGLVGSPPPRPPNYHAQVHLGVGGDMADASISMRDPVFWAWHEYLDSHTRHWETACGHCGQAADYEMAAMPGMAHEAGPACGAARPDAFLPAKSTPGFGVIAIVVVLGWLVRTTRRP